MKKHYILSLLVSLLLISQQSVADIIKVGVLSNTDFQVTLQYWQGLTKHLQSKQSEHTFQILPYHSSSDVAIELAKGKLDYIIAPGQQLQQLAVEHPLTPILQTSNATLELAYTQSASYPVTYQLTHQLLKPGKTHTMPVTWKLAKAQHEEAIPLQLHVSKLINSSKIVVTSLMKTHGNLLLAGLLSILLILGFRKWIARQQRVKAVAEHKKQSATHYIDTVY